MEVNETANDTQVGISRARRYEIGTVIRYRVRGEREWHEGVMENISSSGVLIRTGQSLHPDTSIEMRFVLPVELHGECAAEVLCRGSVVRSSKCAAPRGSVTIAARINHSRFLRQTGKKEEIS
ncbi:MAG TPA: PilZ domain-containing protein [Acidobacteriaceae bacterium]|jgi:hypothetical protein|nr:PilZ domain-containing protein [Acidobacteriaceae bacterium]